MSYHIFGIRHHGPGSARSLRHALEALRPDAILVEGPPEAEAVLPLLTHPEMRPPVAWLIYMPEDPQRAAYYPFAAFSPEWQAIHYALTHQVTVRLMDLPQAHQMAVKAAAEEQKQEAKSENLEAVGAIPETEMRADPLGWLAEAAGYSDGERWWEQMVEQRRESSDLFAAILEAMTALRDTLPPRNDAIEMQREAYMRQTMRAAEREGYERIAVVCGAWHAPALANMSSAKEDAAQLKGLPKVKVQATWVPWTNGRLTFTSGYGAGIESPGWYQHLWNASNEGLTPSAVVIRWMTRVARLLREADLDASAAHVIEAVRLAESLAALRERPLPGLPELNEATQTVLCFGETMPLRLIHEKLIVGETLGAVPEATPMVPLQQDLMREQKRLRLPAEATERMLDLDLRKTNDLERSHLLHRLVLLGLPWGELQPVKGKSSTFHEIWRVQWQPEFAIVLIEAGVWGNTVLDAVTAYARDAADRAAGLPELTQFLDHALLAELPVAINHVMTRLEAEAALASDVAHLMEALPPLVNVLRYGSVRQTDVSLVNHIVTGLIARICIGLPGACASLDDEAAKAMYERVIKVNGAVALLPVASKDEEHLAAWRATLKQMADQAGLHGLLAGRCCRLLLEADAFTAEDAARRMALAFSTASEPVQIAAWVEGFLKGSGLLLLHDETLWRVLDDWVTSISNETFQTLLPLLRRTFATFPAPERRQMGERVRSEMTGMSQATALGSQTLSGDFDHARAEAVLPLVARLLGLENER